MDPFVIASASIKGQPFDRLCILNNSVERVMFRRGGGSEQRLSVLGDNPGFNDQYRVAKRFSLDAFDVLVVLLLYT